LLSVLSVGNLLKASSCVAETLKAKLEVKQEAINSKMCNPEAQKCLDDAVKVMQAQLSLTQRVAMREVVPDPEQEAREACSQIVDL
jgi:hypothetical protein